MLAAYGRQHARIAAADASHSRRLDRGTIGRARREQPAWTGSGSQKPLRERARARAVYSSLRAVSFRKAVRVGEAPRLPTQGPVAKAVIVYFTACKGRGCVRVKLNLKTGVRTTREAPEVTPPHERRLTPTPRPGRLCRVCRRAQLCRVAGARRDGVVQAER